LAGFEVSTEGYAVAGGGWIADGACWWVAPQSIVLDCPARPSPDFNLQLGVRGVLRADGEPVNQHRPQNDDKTQKPKLRASPTRKSRSHCVLPSISDDSSKRAFNQHTF